MRIVSVCLLFFVLVSSSFFTPVSFAASEIVLPEATSGEINDALSKTVPVRFTPSHPLYFLITTKEFLSRILQSSSAKRAEFDFVLSGKRLKETHLLLEENDIEGASNNLRRYGGVLERMIAQVEKARSQNQEVIPLVDLIVEGLQVHETLLFAILQRAPEKDSSFDNNFSLAISAHAETVISLDRIKPGIRSRFNTVAEETTSEPEKVEEKLNDNVLFESTSNSKPRRIIY